MSFTKDGGVGYFYPNRSAYYPTQIGYKENLSIYKGAYQTIYGRAETLSSIPDQIVYNDQKVDIWIQPNTEIEATGGYLFVSSGTPIVYESIDKSVTDTLYDHLGQKANISIQFKGIPLFTDTDTISINGQTYTITTSTSSSTGTTIGVGSGSSQLYYFSQGINNIVPNYTSTYDSSQDAKIVIIADSNDNSQDSEEFIFNFSSTVAVVAGSETSSGSGVYLPEPWKRPWKLKNCFIPSAKIMYSVSSSISSTNTFYTSYNITSSTTLYRPQYSLQVMTDPSTNYGIYWKNGEVTNAKIRFGQNYSGYSNNYFEFELQIASGSVGNTYSWEVRDNPQIENPSGDDIAPYIDLENNGKRIVLYLGRSSQNSSISVDSYEELVLAFSNSGLNIDDFIKFVNINSSVYFSSPSAEIFFSGGSDSTQSNIEEGSIEVGLYDIFNNTYSASYGLAGEIDSLGRDRIVDISSNTPATGDGKHSGLFFGVVSAGETIASRLEINFIEFEALTGGTAGNSITIEYTSGATAGSEVVTEVGNAISIQIEDSVSTSQQIVDAVNAQSSLVKARIFGTASDAQTVSLTPSPLGLSYGKDALSSDSGFFACIRENPDSSSLLYSTSSRSLQIFWFSDINDPNSFHLVSDFSYQSRSSSLIEAVLEFSRRYTSEGMELVFKLGSTTNVAKVQDAGLTYDSNVRFKNKTTGFEGNHQYNIEIVRDVSPGSEEVVVDGNNLTFRINTSNTTTVGDLNNALVAAGLDSSIEIVSKLGTSYTITSTKPLRPIQSALEPWSYSGKVGFGYVNINRKEFFDNASDTNWDTVTYLGPISRENFMSVLYFRANNFNGVE